MLYRSNGLNIRYYKLELFLSLFGDYIVEREYGNIAYKAPTGERKNIFDSKDKAKEFYTKIMETRKKRGYKNDLHSARRSL